MSAKPVYHNRATTFLDDGESFQADFVAWRCDDEHGDTHWELLGPLLAVHSGAKTPVDVHKHVSASEGSWRAMFHVLGLQWSDHIFPPVKAVQAKLRKTGVDESSWHTRFSFTCTSQALVLILAQKATAAKAEETRAKARAAMEAWLAQVVHFRDFKIALNECFSESAGACNLVVHEGYCQHMRAIDKDLGADDGRRPFRGPVWLFVATLQKIYECPAARAVVLHFCARLARMIHSSDDNRGSTNPLKQDRVVAGGRKRRWHEGFKAEVTQGVVQKEKALTGLGACKLEGCDERRLREWQDKQCLSTMACSHRLLGDAVGTFSMSEDGARLGCPAVETKVYAMYHRGQSVALWLPNQAVKEWRGMKHDGVGLASESVAKWKQRLQDFFKGEAERARPSTRKSLGDPNLANQHDLQAWDHALLAGVGRGLAKFRAARPCLPLGPGEARFWVDLATLPEDLQAAAAGRTRRAAVRAADGSTRLECVWSEPRCILHSWLDMGSVGWVGKHIAYGHGKVRGTFGNDPSHRRWGNTLNSLSAAGLTLLKLEAGLVQTFLLGPWHMDGNFRKVEEAAQEWHASSDHRDLLFVHLYPRIVRDLNQGVLPAEFGSDERIKSTWDALPEQLVFWRRGASMKLN
ncbi:unnamed protein product, partial [Prorocentrum cordatum]